MRDQHERAKHESQQKAKKAPKSANLKETFKPVEPTKPVGFVSVSAGEGLEQLFKDLGVDHVIEGGQTMNPSADDIATAVRKINAENVIILPNNSNIILSAEQSRMLIKNRNIFVLDPIPRCKSFCHT